MPVVIKQGDLLKAPVDVIVHQANCFCTMGSGIARRIKEQYPEASIADCKTIPGNESKLGTFSYARSKGKLICNLYGQYRYGRDKRHTDYNAVKKGLTAICLQSPNLTIGIPMGMGCNLAGGDWNIVFNIIKEVAELTKANIEIWSYNP